MTAEEKGYNYALKHYSNNSILDLKQGLLSFHNCAKWREKTQYNKGLKKGIEYLLKTKMNEKQKNTRN